MAKKHDAAPLYHRITKDAWKMSWEHQHLWIFGFFATFIGFSGVSEVFLNAFNKSADFLPATTASLSPVNFIPNIATLQAIVQFSSFPLLSLFIFMTISAIVLAVFAWIVTVAIGALISSIRKIERGGDPTFSEAVKESSEQFVPLLGVNVVTKAVIFLSFFLTGTNLASLLTDNTIISKFVYIVSFILFTSTAIIAVLVEIFGSTAVMIDKKGYNKGLRKGWDFLRTHWILSLEMAFVLFVSAVLIAVVGGLIGLVLAVPLTFFILLTAAFGANAISVMLLTIAAVLAMLFIIAIGSFITTFQTAAWTLLWVELNGSKKRLSHIEHVAGKLSGKKKKR